MKKICSTCGEEKDLEEYSKASHTKAGRIATCRVCINKKNQKRRNDRKERIERGELVVEYKTCNCCNETKKSFEFDRHIGRKDGLADQCKECRKIFGKVQREEKRKSVKIQVEEKCCTKCKQTKPIEEFEKSINSKDGHYRICKVCSRKYSNEYYHKTKETKGLRNLKNSISASIRKWCQANNLKKTKPTIGYGIDVVDIFNHIGPRPSNEYELDHIIPVAIFDYTDEYQIRLSQHPYNLRWILAHDNGSKNDVIVWSLISADTFLSTVAEYIGLNSSHDGMRARDIVL